MLAHTLPGLLSLLEAAAFEGWLRVWTGWPAGHSELCDLQSGAATAAPLASVCGLLNVRALYAPIGSTMLD